MNILLQCATQRLLHSEVKPGPTYKKLTEFVNEQQCENIKKVDRLLVQVSIDNGSRVNNKQIRLLLRKINARQADYKNYGETVFSYRATL